MPFVCVFFFFLVKSFSLYILLYIVTTICGEFVNKAYKLIPSYYHPLYVVLIVWMDLSRYLHC